MTEFRDEFTFRALLEGGHTFTFSVQDWDTGEKPLSDEEVLGMASGLLRDRVALYGSLGNTRRAVMAIDPARVVGVALLL